MHQEVILIASVILGAFLVPSLITVHPNPYDTSDDEFTELAGPVSQPTE